MIDLSISMLGSEVRRKKSKRTRTLHNLELPNFAFFWYINSPLIRRQEDAHVEKYFKQNIRLSFWQLENVNVIKFYTL